MKTFLSALLNVILLLTLAVAARGNSVSASQSLTANLGAKAKVAVVQPAVSLVHSGGTFANFTGNVTVRYKVRTTTTGTSTLTVAATSEFTPANGPSIAASDLTYTCSGATLGTPCTGSQTVRTSTQGTVVTVGGGACTGSGCSGNNPNSVSISLRLVNSPVFRTGSYSTSLTFSISAL